MIRALLQGLKMTFLINALKSFSRTGSGHFSKAAVLSLMMSMAGIQTSSGDTGFQQWISSFERTAKSQGISEQTYRKAFAGVTTPDPSVLKAARYQPEFVKPIWEYLDGAVSDSRVTNGRQKLAQYSEVLQLIEEKTGVDKHVLVAIWGVESSYGAVLDNPNIVKNLFRSLATLAYGDPKRAKFARSQLIAALKIAQRGDIDPSNMTGSWAGAMGHTQFIPTSYLSYSLDYEGDGKVDIWNNPKDALATAASLLARNGWERGKTWGYEVNLPSGFNWQLADEKTRRTLGEWQSLGVTRVGDKAFPRPEDRAFLIAPAGSNGPAFVMLKNFDVIKRYNNATSYALGVGHLADRIAGFGGFAKDWPRRSKPLSRQQAEQLQTLLTRKGFPVGKIDGKIGPATRNAVRAYQRSVGLTPDGYADTLLLNRLQG
jgi:membrane-bound lytic murein transglycosylase B